jgi:hypothetical protein
MRETAHTMKRKPTRKDLKAALKAGLAFAEKRSAGMSVDEWKAVLRQAITRMRKWKNKRRGGRRRR